jgi:hypothetical protein
MFVMPLLHQLRERSYQMTVFHLGFSNEFVPSFAYALYKLGQTGRRLRNFVCAFENLRRSTVSSDVPVRLSARMEQIDFAGFS